VSTVRGFDVLSCRWMTRSYIVTLSALLWAVVVDGIVLSCLVQVLSTRELLADSKIWCQQQHTQRQCRADREWVTLSSHERANASKSVVRQWPIKKLEFWHGRHDDTKKNVMCGSLHWGFARHQKGREMPSDDDAKPLAVCPQTTTVDIFLLIISIHPGIHTKCTSSRSIYHQ
jgi:hypothetical protein